jgi:hypothetical protein
MAKRTDSRKNRKEDKKKINGATIYAAVKWLLGGGILDQVRLHGNTGWVPMDLVVLAVVWAWDDDATLTGAFENAHRWSLKVLGRAAVGTFQGFMKALVKYTGQLLPLLWERMQFLMEAHGGEHWQIGVWKPFAVDGSRVTTPRSEANEEAFCAANYGGSRMAKYRRRQARKKGKRRRKKKPQPVKPQIWLTLLWHMGLKLPWSWKSGPSTSSERDHLKEMLAEQKFPKNTLFCGDAGFTGYELWKAILDAGHNFLIRVGANVTLLRGLGYCVRERDGIVYCWPEKAAKKNKLPPLTLRIIRFQLGRGEVCLVTNVLSSKKLTEKQAMELYRMRWGVELQFRTLKQTFGRRKLRSRTPDRAYVELDWSFLGLAMIQLFAIKEQIEIGEPPDNCSVSLAIRIIRETVQRWSERPSSEEALDARLQTAVKDDYERQSSKEARYKPNYKEKPSAGKPKIVKATRKHKQWLQQYLQNAA